MKTKLTLGLTIVACAAAAHAQSTVSSNVTLFGVVDANFRQVHNGSAGTQRSEGNNGLSSSRVGFRGVEALSDDLSAGFWLEHGFSVDTGAVSDSSRFWNRRATVSLISKTYGEIRIGRDYSPTYNALVIMDPFGDNGVAAITNIVSTMGSGATTLTRADNEFNYYLPANRYGIFGTFMVAPGEKTDGKKYAGGYLGYKNDALMVTVGYGQTDALGDKFKQAIVGATYDLKWMMIYAGWIQDKFAENKQNVYNVGLSAPVGPGVAKVAYTLGKMSGPASTLSNVADGDDASRWGVGYVYNLSKRTSIYGTYAFLKNKGNSTLTIASSPSGIEGGQNSNGYEIGLKTSF